MICYKSDENEQMHGQGAQWPFCEDLPAKTPEIPPPPAWPTNTNN